MQLFVLDDDGKVVFEFGTDVNGNVSGYRLNPAKLMQAKVIKMINEALQFLGRRP